MFFLRKSNLEQLPVAMSGVRMGERALQMGIDDPLLAGAIAAKVGLSGHAAFAVSDEAGAARARAAAAKAGALVDLQVGPLSALPFDPGSFDVVVVHGTGGLLSALDADARVAALREGHRVLRTGGRIVVIERGRPAGAFARLRAPRVDPAYESAGGAVAALAAAGFRAPRVLAEREGYRFSEGLKA
jgi:SAM-dependent methyltransferase